jgi:hypothetical protein
MAVPANPKIYHIVHLDKLASIVADGCLWSDAELAARPVVGTVIGMNSIKVRRMTELTLTSHPGLYVGECVPFYFCPRSVMLYLIHKRNAELTYRGGQGPIVHLVADLNAVVAWANANGRRWAFTLSNAGSYYFEDRADLAQLAEINWASVAASQWSGSPTKEQKQAEFLIEQHFPWELIEEIGVINQHVGQRVTEHIPERVNADEAYQNAQKNSDKQNARIELDKALKTVIVGLMKDDTQLFKQFSDNEDFRRWLSDNVFAATYKKDDSTGSSPQR